MYHKGIIIPAFVFLLFIPKIAAAVNQSSTCNMCHTCCSMTAAFGLLPIKVTILYKIDPKLPYCHGLLSLLYQSIANCIHFPVYMNKNRSTMLPMMVVGTRGSMNTIHTVICVAKTG